MDEELAVQLARESMTVEDLRPEDRAKYEKVRDEGMGICGSCRWSSGCLRCHREKAWDYYVRQALGYEGSKAKPKKAGAKAKGGAKKK